MDQQKKEEALDEVEEAEIQERLNEVSREVFDLEHDIF